MSELASAYDYPLPDAAIAQRPAGRRDSCKLAVVHRQNGQVEHRRFNALPQCLRPGDLLVLNDSKVMAARVPCRRQSGGKVEVFLLDPQAGSEALPAFLKPAGKLREGELLRPERSPLRGAFQVGPRLELGVWRLAWRSEGAPWSPQLLEQLGLPPLPPYIRRERLPDARQRSLDKAWYQCTYAQVPGSVAAPTAGLHFTPGLLKRLSAKGIESARVTLHVGAGTFQPIKTERIEEHRMHQESFCVGAETAEAIRRCRQRRGRVVAVGTTALRALESAALDQGGFRESWSSTQLFIRPGYRFKAVNALITNFHQPRSTLLALVAAFWDREGLLKLYQDCLDRKYRFLSYGDACLFL